MAEQEPDSTQERDVRLAYVTTGYPYVSQTFILREVTELRRLGVSIDTFAVWSSDETHILSMADQEAARTTYYIRPPHPAHFALALLSLLQTNGRWWRTLWRVLRRASSLRGLIWQLAYYVQAAVLWHQVRRRGLRHIHAHFANVSSDLAMIACGLGGPGWSWSFTMHGPTEFSDVEMFRLPEKVVDARFVVCISDFCRSQLMALVNEAHWSKLEVVHCAVDTATFEPVPAQSAQRAQLLCVARLAPVKGHAVLLDSLAMLRDRGIETHTVFVGDGPNRNEISQLIEAHGLSEYVTLAGAVGQDQIGEYFAAADLFVLPSFGEGVPVVLMEAMAMEIPVIATRIAGIPELVDDGLSGRLVTPGRSDQLADAIAELIADPAARRAIGAAARIKIIEEFEASTCARALQDVFARHFGLVPVELANARAGSLDEA